MSHLHCPQIISSSWMTVKGITELKDKAFPVILQSPCKNTFKCYLNSNSKRQQNYLQLKEK